MVGAGLEEALGLEVARLPLFVFRNQATQKVESHNDV